MKSAGIICLVLVLAGIFIIPVASAQISGEYNKIVQIRLDFQDNRYSVAGIDVRYGSAPNLNLRSGSLTGSILDSHGSTLDTFNIQNSGMAVGDILLSSDSGDLAGYTEQSASRVMILTVPYRQDMQQFILSDSQDGSRLVSADLNFPVAAFCTDYSQDPDCLMRSPPVRSGVPDTNLSMALAAMLSASFLIAIGLVLWTIRRRRPVQVPVQNQIPVTVTVPEKKSVLIVDDNPDLVELIHLLLEMEGYEVLTASGGEECLELLKKQIPDLVLRDVGMEPMDGWVTLEHIKNDPATKSIPVLMLTGLSLTAEAAKHYHICIDDYLTKPFRNAELYGAITGIIERKKKLKETLDFAKVAGVTTEKFCEFAKLTRRITVDKKIINILLESDNSHKNRVSDDEEMAIIDEINAIKAANQRRAEQLRGEINTAFRLKGLPEMNW